MKKISAVDILSLSIPERIQLVEDIWDTVAAQVDAIELTKDEKKTIDQRLTAYHKNPEAGSAWKDVYKRITAKNGI